jgi:malate dehydrogenase (quinone)
MSGQVHEVIIVGGGVSGTALLYTLARYTDVQSIALLEKYDTLAPLNSNARANSQTLHCGDIETNYGLDKALQVKQIATMVVRYGARDPDAGQYLRAHPKMVIGVGEQEVDHLSRRHAAFAEAFPYLELWSARRIAEVEPQVTDLHGRLRPQPLIASGCTDQVCAVDFGRLSESFARRALEQPARVEVRLGTRVRGIREREGEFAVITDRATWHARAVAVCAGAHSLLLAHGMGHGLEYAILPVAGSFYHVRRALRAKVYTVQNPKLPFAALHADPDLTQPGLTRLGPTALVLPKLERYRPGTYLDFLRALRPDRAVLAALWGLVRDPEIRAYIGRNLLFEVPMLGRRLFLEDARKIIPSLGLKELRLARGVGGVRPQIIDRRQGHLVLGEALLDTGRGALFNVTPSPGATTCLGNAYRNARSITAHLGRRLDDGRLVEELLGGTALSDAA